jgi:hypothetical protein
VRSGPVADLNFFALTPPTEDEEGKELPDVVAAMQVAASMARDLPDAAHQNFTM